MAQQKAMDVTGQNITNVNTKGYSRQRVILESHALYSSDRIKVGMGVKIDSVVQLVDQFINRSIYQKMASVNEYASKASVLSHMESIFNEVTDHGLGQAVNQFWEAWQDLANNPGGIPERTALLQKSEILCRQFNAMSEDLYQIKKNMNTNLRTAILDLNSLSQKIAKLNEQIVAAEVSGTRANDLRDQRNHLIEKVSEWVGNVYLENDKGSLTVMMSDGTVLVDGNYYWALSQDGDKIYWNHRETDISKRLSGGKIGAWLDLRDEIVPQYLANLDELAGTLIHEVNTLHLGGYTLSGQTGKYFFENFKEALQTPNGNNFSGAAAYIKLSLDVKNTPGQIAAGGQSGDPGDNENALRMVGLQTDDTLGIKKWSYEGRGTNISNTTLTQTMDDYYRTLVGDIGILTGGVSRNHEFTQAMMDHLDQLRSSVSGVNLDEEMTELLKVQRAYEAAAKLVTVADEMLRTLLNMR